MLGRKLNSLHKAVMQSDCARCLPVLEASLHQAGVNLDVGTEIELLAHVIQNGESLVESLAAAEDLQEDAEGVVGWRDSSSAHVVHELKCVVESALLCTTIQERVVQNLIHRELRAPLHLTETSNA